MSDQKKKRDALLAKMNTKRQKALRELMQRVRLDMQAERDHKNGKPPN